MKIRGNNCLYDKSCIKLSNSPNNTVNIFRSVDDEEKAFALGVQFVMLRIFGKILFSIISVYYLCQYY